MQKLFYLGAYVDKFGRYSAGLRNEGFDGLKMHGGFYKNIFKMTRD